MQKWKVLACVPEAGKVLGDARVHAGEEIRVAARPKACKPCCLLVRMHRRPRPQLGGGCDADRLVPKNVRRIPVRVRERPGVIRAAARCVA